MNTRPAFAWVVVGVLSVLTLLLLWPFLPWLLATGFLAFAFTPLQRRLAARIGSRAAAAALVSLVVLVVLALVVLAANALLASQAAIGDEVVDARVFGRVHHLVERTTGLSVPVRRLVEQAITGIQSWLDARAGDLVAGAVHATFGVLLSVFVLYYLLRDGDRFVAWLRAVVPLPDVVRDELFAAADEMAWAVIKGHVVVAFVQGFVAGLSLVATGVPYAIPLTLAMMALAIVPVIGVSSVLAGAVLYLLSTGQVLSAAFVVVWGLTAVAVTDDYLRALLIDRETGLHPASIFVGIAGGTYLLGFMGLFVGPILIGLFKAAVEVLGGHYGVFEPPGR